MTPRGGLAFSAQVIAAAALIMICVFGSFILNGDPVVKQFGVGLAVAVALAATMVLLLAPALLVLMGRGTWWLPPLARQDRPAHGHRGGGVPRGCSEARRGCRARRYSNRRVLSALSIWRRASRSAMSRRLSRLAFPRASASSSFTRPFLK